MISSAMDGPWRSHYSYIFYVQVNLPRVQRSRAIMPNNNCPSNRARERCRMQIGSARGSGTQHNREPFFRARSHL